MRLRTAVKMSILDSNAFTHSTFTAPVTRCMNLQRRFAKTPERDPVVTPPCQCDHVFEGDIPPRSRYKTVSGSVVAVATHVARATPDHAAMLPLPPAHFDANAVAEFGLSMTIIMSPGPPLSLLQHSLASPSNASFVSMPPQNSSSMQPRCFPLRRSAEALPARTSKYTLYLQRSSAFLCHALYSRTSP